MNASEILIDIAQDRYPIGTVVKSAVTGTEFTSSGSFILNEDSSIYSVAKQGAFSLYDARMKKWAEVVKACVNEPKSLLEGKVAIQVNNEREFKLLMEHYESKGWKWTDDKMRPLKFIPREIREGVFPQFIAYQNKFHYCNDAEWLGNEGYNMAPFSDFAAEVGIKVPVLVMTSEDGVPLYEGDEYYRACLGNNEKWHIQGVYNATPTSIIFKHPNGLKAFSTKEAAEAWILEANKPQYKTIELFHGMEARIYETEVRVMDADAQVTTITHSDLEEMLHFMNLQQQSDKNASE